jgi:hypothetical protein
MSGGMDVLLNSSLRDACRGGNLGEARRLVEEGENKKQEEGGMTNLEEELETYRGTLCEVETPERKRANPAEISAESAEDLGQWNSPSSLSRKRSRMSPGLPDPHNQRPMVYDGRDAEAGCCVESCAEKAVFFDQGTEINNAFCETHGRLAEETGYTCFTYRDDGTLCLRASDEK